MNNQIIRTETEIDELLDECFEAINNGSNWPGLSYEEGIEATLNWLRDRTKGNPLSED